MVWDDPEEPQLAFQELKREDKEIEDFNRQANEYNKEMEKQRNPLRIFREMIDHETILGYGQPKVGKTFASASFVEAIIKNGGHVFIINTDNGVKRTYQAYFKDKFNDVMKHISYYLVTDFDNINEVINEIKIKVTFKDLIIIDLIDDFWEMAQSKFIEDVCKGMGISLADYILMASKQSDKFGTLDKNQWQYVKKLDEMLITNFVIRPPCMIFASCGAKDIEVAKIYAKRDPDILYELNKFEEVGSRPGGQKRLHYKFNTVVYMGEKRDGKKYFILMGDRGFLRNSQKIEYERNFYEAFMRLRK